MLARHPDLRSSVAARPVPPGAAGGSGREFGTKKLSVVQLVAQSRDEAVPEDGVLLARVAEGDETAFRVLTERHLRSVVGLARRMLGEAAEAEDIAQETMLRLWRLGGQLEVGAVGVRAWLLRVARNLCIDHLRGGQRLRVVDEVPEEIEEPRQLDELQAADVSARVEQAMMELPDRQRTALLLFHNDGLSLAEIGQEMGVSAEAVESLLARGRRGLKAKLAGAWRQLLDLEPDGSGK